MEFLEDLLKDLYEATPEDVSVGYGFITKNGVTTDEVGIIFSVKEKKPLSKLKDHEVLPKNIDLGNNGVINCDVIGVGEVSLLQCNTNYPILNSQLTACESFVLTPPINRSLTRPLKGGLSITATRKLGTVGTMGAIVLDKHTNALVGLTNNHVVNANAIRAQYQNTNAFLGNNFPITNEFNPTNFVYQPGETGAPPASTKIGQVVRYVPIFPNQTVNNATNPPTSNPSPGLIQYNQVDGALISLDCEDIDINESWKIMGFESFMTQPLDFASTFELDTYLLNPNLQVYSSGRTTGPKGQLANGCPLRIAAVNQILPICCYTWHNLGLPVPQSTFSTYGQFDRLISFRKPNNLNQNCFWPCAGGDSGSVLIADLGSVTGGTPLYKIIGLVFAGNSPAPVPCPAPTPFSLNVNTPNGTVTITCPQTGPTYIPFNPPYICCQPPYTSPQTFLGFANRIDDVANQLGIKAWTGNNPLPGLVDVNTLSTVTLPGLSSVTAYTCNNKTYYQMGLQVGGSPCPSSTNSVSLQLSSSSFLNGTQISNLYKSQVACGNTNNSPSINLIANTLTNLNPSTYVSYFSLQCVDNSIGGFVHWSVTNIPNNIFSPVPGTNNFSFTLPQNGSWPVGTTINPTNYGSGDRTNGWNGPCPPGGTHNYQIIFTAHLNALGGGGTISSNILTFTST
jgi:phosphatidylethanolamine-binding protein (PEBP) family uncharacterized protein